MCMSPCWFCLLVLCEYFTCAYRYVFPSYTAFSIELTFRLTPITFFRQFFNRMDAQTSTQEHISVRTCWAVIMLWISVYWLIVSPSGDQSGLSNRFRWCPFVSIVDVAVFAKIVFVQFGLFRLNSIHVSSISFELGILLILPSNFASHYVLTSFQTFRSARFSLPRFGRRSRMFGVVFSVIVVTNISF